MSTEEYLKLSHNSNYSRLNIAPIASALNEQDLLKAALWIKEHLRAQCITGCGAPCAGAFASDLGCYCFVALPVCEVNTVEFLLKEKALIAVNGVLDE